MELWRGILGGVRDYLGLILGGFERENQGHEKETSRTTTRRKSENKKNLENPIGSYLNSLLSYWGVCSVLSVSSKDVQACS